MKTVHRVIAILAAFLMLYLGATGTLMQLLDLRAILGHAPENDATVISIHEGENGNPGFVVMGLHDLTASALPTSLDYPKAMASTLAQVHQAAPDAAPRYVELRMLDGRLVGQAELGEKQAVAFDLTRRDAVAPLAFKPGMPPPSLRQTLKEWHRFWTRKDVPGVWFELLSGVVLWVLIVTGLTLYFRMLSARIKLGRMSPFWLAGDPWRGLHRIVSVVAALFLIAIAASGTWLGFESVWHTFMPRLSNDLSSPISDPDALATTKATLRAFRDLEPQTPIKVLRVRTYAGMEQGVVVTGGEQTRQIVFNAATGKTMSLTQAGHPASGFPLGIQVHEDVKHFHSGHMFGLSSRWMNLFAGLSLIFLSVSGLWMYVDLWRKRARLGRNGLFWV